MQPQRIRVLLADDDAVVRRLLPRQLDAASFEVVVLTDGQNLVAELRRAEADVVLLDVNLPDGSGLDFLQQIRRADDAPEVVMLTADESLQTGLEAMRLGAYDYITKPATPAALEIVIRKAIEKRELVRQNERLRVAVRHRADDLTIEPISSSPMMREILEQAKRVAALDTTVLITGESGTGKDVLARWIHAQSPRRAAPLISVNCGALPENLFESEFFGHEKGAFTGATAQKIGLIEAADGSTLFLDEIGELPLAMQVKLLHFLENGTFRRVGSTRDRKTDARVIAATNRHLAAEIERGRFRADLFYRLNVVAFAVPPLRERRADVEALIDYFLRQLQHRFGKPHLRISPGARAQLERQEWRGNVRELKNALERAAVFAADDEIKFIGGLGDFAAAESGSPKNSSQEPLAPLAEIEKQHILRVLRETGGRRERAAAILGITARTLYRKLQEFGGESNRIE